MLREIRSYPSGHVLLADWDHIGRILSERERVRKTLNMDLDCRDDLNGLSSKPCLILQSRHIPRLG